MPPRLKSDSQDYKKASREGNPFPLQQPQFWGPPPQAAATNYPQHSAKQYLSGQKSLTQELEMASMWYLSWQTFHWHNFWMSRYPMGTSHGYPTPPLVHAPPYPDMGPPPAKAMALSAKPPKAIKKEETSGHSDQVTQSQQSSQDTLGMLLRSGKHSKIFKPYDHNEGGIHYARMGGARRRRVRPGCKRKYDECSYSKVTHEKSVLSEGDSEFDFEDLEDEEEEVQILDVPQKTETTIGNLFPEILTMVFDKLDVQSKGRAAQVGTISF